MMRCERFRSLDACFGVCSELLVLPTHWALGRTWICPRSADGECDLCRSSTPKLVGYAVVRSVDPAGQFRPPCIAEMPMSMCWPLVESVDDWLDGVYWSMAARGKVARFSREAKRAGWKATSIERRSLQNPHGRPVVLDGVQRLYRLPGIAGAPPDSFADRFGPAVRDSLRLAILGGAA